jgi:acetoin utilization deacetylase AcuC-like enzyme
MGFCLFNNVAVPAELAIRELGVRPVMIIDWDVHHGNGTAEIFRRRPDVLVASIHQSGLFPGTGALTDAGSGEGRGYTVNIRFPVGRGRRCGDPLADCMLDAESFAAMARHVRDLASELHVPLGAVLEGGYDPHALGRQRGRDDRRAAG